MIGFFLLTFQPSEQFVLRLHTGLAGPLSQKVEAPVSHATFPGTVLDPKTTILQEANTRRPPLWNRSELATTTSELVWYLETRITSPNAGQAGRVLPSRVRRRARGFPTG